MNSAASQSSSSGCVGGCPITPKSSGVGDDAAAKMALPNAIHHHARARAACEPSTNDFGQLQPAAAVRRRRMLLAAQHLQPRARALRSPNVLMVAANENALILGRALGHGQRIAGRRQSAHICVTAWPDARHDARACSSRCGLAIARAGMQFVR